MKTNTTSELIELAKTGKYLPVEFIMAIYHIPGIDVANMQSINDQWFDAHGKPVNFPDDKSFLLEDVVTIKV